MIQKNSKQIRGIIFDLGNVIYRFDPAIFSAKVGIDVDLGQAIYNSPWMRAYETGKLATADFFMIIHQHYYLAISQSEFALAFNEIFTPIPETLQLLRQLQRRYKLGLLSNTNELHFRYLYAQGKLDGIFDSISVSFEVGALKPSAAIYYDALNKLCLPPEHCVYIDDIDEYVYMARQLGMHGIHYLNSGQLLLELKQLGVIVDENQ